MTESKFRTHTCLCCNHKWTSEVVMSQHSPAISGERTEQCPTCDSRAVVSTPWHEGGLSPAAKDRINAKIKHAMGKRAELNGKGRY